MYVCMYVCIIVFFYYPGPLIILISCYTKTFLHIRNHFMHQRSNISPVYLNTMLQSSTQTIDDTKTQVTAISKTRMTSNPGTRGQVTSEPGTPVTANPEIQVTSVRETQAETKCKELDRQEIHITRTLFIVVCLFFLCISPYFVALLILGARNASVIATIFFLVTLQ